MRISRGEAGPNPNPNPNPNPYNFLTTTVTVTITLVVYLIAPHITPDSSLALTPPLMLTPCHRLRGGCDVGWDEGMVMIRDSEGEAVMSNDTRPWSWKSGRGDGRVPGAMGGVYKG